MPTSDPGSSRGARATGFTLVELMVVIAVIGVAATAAVLAMPDPRGRVLDEGARFAARVRAANDAAIVEARPVAVWVTPSGYGFDRWQGAGWRPMEKPLGITRWGEGTRATGLVRERVIFDSTGLADRPLQLTLSREGRRATVSIEANGRVRVAG